MPKNDQIVSPETMMEIFKETVSVFDEHLPHYWIDWGALLGIIRQDEFIPWDNDIDIGIWSKDINGSTRKKLLKAMWARGYKGGLTINKAKFTKRGVKIDALLFEKVGDRAIRTIIFPTSLLAKILYKHSLIFGRFSCEIFYYLNKILYWILQRLSHKTYRMIMPLKYFSPTITYYFRGTRIQIPNDTENYLEFHYGKDWQVPKKDWEDPTDGNWENPPDPEYYL